MLTCLLICLHVLKITNLWLLWLSLGDISLWIPHISACLRVRQLLPFIQKYSFKDFCIEKSFGIRVSLSLQYKGQSCLLPFRKDLGFLTSELFHKLTVYEPIYVDRTQVIPTGLWSKRNWYQFAHDHATFYAVSNKVLYFDLHILCLLASSTQQYWAKLWALK